MRTRFNLLVAAAWVAACSDQQQPTSPVNSRPTAESRVGATIGPSQDKAPVPQTKPTDQVGFTKVTQVLGAQTVVNAGASAEIVVACPAGSTPVGGAYVFSNFTPGASRPFVAESMPTAAGGIPQGWILGVVNDAPAAVAVIVSPRALCAS
jgi:hypothetical protein